MAAWQLAYCQRQRWQQRWQQATLSLLKMVTHCFVRPYNVATEFFGRINAKCAVECRKRRYTSSLDKEKRYSQNIITDVSQNMTGL